MLSVKRLPALPCCCARCVGVALRFSTPQPLSLSVYCILHHVFLFFRMRLQDADRMHHKLLTTPGTRRARRWHSPFSPAAPPPLPKRRLLSFQQPGCKRITTHPQGLTRPASRCSHQSFKPIPRRLFERATSACLASVRWRKACLARYPSLAKRSIASRLRATRIRARGEGVSSSTRAH